MLQTLILISIIIFISALLGSMVGLGGGFLIVPLLTILAGLEIHDAIALSLVSIIGVSTSSLSNYISEGNVDFKIGSLLELATVIGAVGGAHIALSLASKYLFLIFGGALLYISMLMYRGGSVHEGVGSGASYRGSRLYRSMLISLVAGILSGLLGIGGGVLKVPIMTLYLGMPIKTAIGTSEYMISITSSAGSYVYLGAGKLNTAYLGPAFTSSVLGAQLGSRLSIKTRPAILRKIFASLMLVFSFIMIWRGFLI